MMLMMLIKLILCWFYVDVDVDIDVDFDVDVDVRTTINNFGDFFGTEIVSQLNSDTRWEIGIQET